MKKFVIDNPAPFIVPIANWSGETVQSAHEPLRTVTSYPKGGAFSVVSPVIVGAGGPEYSGKPTAADQPIGTLLAQNHRGIAAASLVQLGNGDKAGSAPRTADLHDPLGTIMASGGKYGVAAAHLVKFRFDDAGKALDEPLPTITSGGNYQRPAGAAHAMGISTVFMAQMNGGFNTTHAKGADEPMTTVTNTGSQQQLVAANLVHLRGNCDARDLDDPLHTISAGGTHHGLVSAFMERQFGASVGQGLK